MSKKEIINKIKRINKPINIEEYLEICLYGRHGYYKNNKAIGKEGDFVTAPEISQLFGEILGLYIYSFWKNKINKTFKLIELGPGKGTLLIDILNITKSFKNFHNSMKINLIETNNELIKLQKKNLKKFSFRRNNIIWKKNFRISKKYPVIIYANEFLDCLPIRQFYKKEGIWSEKMIKFDKKHKKLKLIDKKLVNQNILLKINMLNSINTLEISNIREKYFIDICNQIKINSGLAIFIDYGYYSRPNYFTLQSVFNHKKTNVLENVGNQDITSLVDFKKLTEIAKSKNLNIDIFTSQRDFLIKNGIYERAKKIMFNCNSIQKKNILNGTNRLVDNENMGSLFKVLAISN